MKRTSNINADLSVFFPGRIIQAAPNQSQTDRPSRTEPAVAPFPHESLFPRVYPPERDNTSSDTIIIPLPMAEVPQFVEGDDVFSAGFPRHLQEQLDKNCALFNCETPTCTASVNGPIHHPNYRPLKDATAQSISGYSEPAPFLIPGTDEVLLSAHYRYQEKGKILVAKQKDKTEWMGGKAVILIYRDQKIGSRTKWHVWDYTLGKRQFHRGGDFAERASSQEFEKRNSQLIPRRRTQDCRASIMTNSDLPDIEHSSHRPPNTTTGQKSLVEDDISDSLPVNQQKGSDVARLSQQYSKEMIVSLRVPSSRLRKRRRPMAGSYDFGESSSSDESDDPVLQRYGRRRSGKYVQQNATSAVIQDEKTGNSQLTPAETSSEKDVSDGACEVVDRERDTIWFLFEKYKHDRSPARKPLRLCDTVSKLFYQALCQGAATRQSGALQIRIHERSHLVRIARDDAEDFENLKKVLLEKAREHGTIEAVVTDLAFE